MLPSPTARTSGTLFISSANPRLTTFTAPFIHRNLSLRHAPLRKRARSRFVATASARNGLPPTPGIVPADLKQEMTRSYMEYAMSVILGRAMPDVRDGLKPVHRRILFAMHELGLSPGGQFRKSARVVGEVLGKYHPHGDTAVYDALVRMAQPFAMSIPLVNGHGNFGSTDGDPAAAMRYTECKLAHLTRDVFLADMGRDTVSYVPNFDGSESEPLVLPAKVPNLLVNGSSGIAVGMATNIPPHNLGEVVAALKAIIADPELSDDDLLALVPAPDFPTGGQILGTDGARDMHMEGRGRIVVRACVHPEVVGGEDGSTRRQQREAIVVTELPYQVNKATLVGKIAELVNDKKLDGVADLRDESDRNGTRIVIELKRDAMLEVVLNNLFKKTQLQSSFSANVMALDNGRFPIRLTLRNCLEKFLKFRRETIRRRVQFDLRKAEDRFHIVQGFLIVQEDIDTAIADIRGSQDSAEARGKLMKRLSLSARQADSVLAMQLKRLTSLEKNRLVDESETLQRDIAKYNGILSTPTKLDGIIVDELTDISDRHACPRRSKIIMGRGDGSTEIDELSLFSNERSVITVTEKGYVKRMPTSAFENQNRGGRGKRGAGKLREGDRIVHFFSCMSHDSLIAISKSGVAYKLSAHKVPLASLGSRGVPLFQLLPAVPAGEAAASVLSVTDFSDRQFLVLLTRNGYVKKTAASVFESLNAGGKRIIALDHGDELKWVRHCTENDSMLIASQKGYIIRFATNKQNLRASGRQSRGVRSMRLVGSDAIADMDIMSAHGMIEGNVSEEDEGAMNEEEDEDENIAEDPDASYVLAVTRHGAGKRIDANSFRMQCRAGRGMIGMKFKANGRDDCIVSLQTCHDDDSVMVVTCDGTIVRTLVKDIPVQRRYSQGVRIQRLGQKDTVAAVAILPQLLTGEEVVEGDDVEEGEEVVFGKE